jgi:hypothetical protein
MKYKEPDAKEQAAERVSAEAAPKTSSERARRQLAGLSYDEQVAAMSASKGKPGASKLPGPSDYAGVTEALGAGAKPLTGAQKAPAKPVIKPHPKANVEGIASSLSVERFVAAARELHKSWSEKGAVARADELGDAANTELEQASVPSTGIVVRDLGVRSGEFDHQPWDLALARETFEQPEISTDDMSTVAGVVYHEARHAEQWHRMMRLEAGRGVSADQLAETYAIKKEVAKDAAAEPLTASGKDGHQASAWHESVYGSKLEERGRILGQLNKRGAVFQGSLDAMNAAADEYDRLVAHPATDTAAVQAAEEKWNSLTSKYIEAQTAFEAVYEQYRALPEERDAWKVGERVEDALSE